MNVDGDRIVFRNVCALVSNCAVARFGIVPCSSVLLRIAYSPRAIRQVYFVSSWPASIPCAVLSENFEIHDLCFVRQSTYVRRAALYVTADCPVCQPCIKSRGGRVILDSGLILFDKCCWPLSMWAFGKGAKLVS